ncbi:MAG: hypothetical protein JKY65_16655 [Planctomycetes bacterium]|nr:hypothetical protein [Planctomycetota bacterium]
MFKPSNLVKRVKSIWANLIVLLVCLGIGVRLGPGLVGQASEWLGTSFAWPIRFFGGALLGVLGGFAWFWYEQRPESELQPILATVRSS